VDAARRWPRVGGSGVGPGDRGLGVRLGLGDCGRGGWLGARDRRLLEGWGPVGVARA
jgi:hypothetical protein